MTSMEKRDIIVKETLTPLFKGAGFKKSGRTWWTEREDCFLIVYMKNSRYNNQETGVWFSFQISASAKEEIRGKISEQWIGNQLTCIEEAYFLPHCGFLHPYRNGLSGYVIDGKRNDQPLDLPVEAIAERIRLDFKDYILPELVPVQTLEAWNALKERLQNRFYEKEIRLLRYFEMAHSLSCSDYNRPVLLHHQKSLELTDQDIYDHMDLARTVAENSRFSGLDSETYILETLAGKP